MTTTTSSPVSKKIKKTTVFRLDPVELSVAVETLDNNNVSAATMPPALPKSFRLFKFGENQSTKGTFYMDDDSVSQIMESYTKRGNKLPIDYDHGSTDLLALDPAESRKAAGWFKLEQDPVTKDLMAVDVKWTRPAQAKLLEGEFKYISPTFLVDEEDESTIVDLMCAALTNTPALFGQTELVNVLSSGTPTNKSSLPEKVLLNTTLVNKELPTSMTTTNSSNVTMSMSEEDLLKLQRENEELKAFMKASQKAQADIKIASAINEQRLLPAHRKYAESIFERDGLEGLDAYLGTLSARPGAKPLTAPVTHTVQNNKVLSPASSRYQPSVATQSPQYTIDEDTGESVELSQEEQLKAKFLARPLREGEQVIARFLGIKEKKYNKNLYNLQDVKSTGPNSISAQIDLSVLDRKKRMKKGEF